MRKAEASKLLTRIRRDGFDPFLVFREDDFSPWVVRVEFGQVVVDVESPRQWTDQRGTLLHLREATSQ